eukprot:2219647-Pleurochrysis_carterae.AAC.1
MACRGAGLSTSFFARICLEEGEGRSAGRRARSAQRARSVRGLTAEVYFKSAETSRPFEASSVTVAHTTRLKPCATREQGGLCKWGVPKCRSRIVLRETTRCPPTPPSRICARSLQSLSSPIRTLTKAIWRLRIGSDWAPDLSSSSMLAPPRPEQKQETSSAARPSIRLRRTELCALSAAGISRAATGGDAAPALTSAEAGAVAAPTCSVPAGVVASGMKAWVASVASFAGEVCGGRGAALIGEEGRGSVLQPAPSLPRRF